MTLLPPAQFAGRTDFASLKCPTLSEFESAGETDFGSQRAIPQTVMANGTTVARCKSQPGMELPGVYFTHGTAKQSRRPALGRGHPGAR